MRENYTLTRLFIKQPLSLGCSIDIDKKQFNYLVNVLRLSDEQEILLFNGIDGEWVAKLNFESRKKLRLCPTKIVREQPKPSTLIYLFAPIKQARLEYIVQKATEMGVSEIIPVITQHTQVHKLNIERLQANIIEACEQCGVLSVPKITHSEKLISLLDGWNQEKQIIFCDEGIEENNPYPILSKMNSKNLALLIGPEGGFSNNERIELNARDFVTSISLGPRILRADTAGVAALALIQAACGDWN